MRKTSACTSGGSRWRLGAMATAGMAAAAMAGPGAAGAVQVSRDIPLSPAGGEYNQGKIASDPAHPGHLAATYFNQRPGQTGTCRLALSPDSGRTWTSKPLAGTGTRYPLPAGMDTCFFATPVYGPDGTLYITFSFTHKYGYSQIDMLISKDGGASFGPLAVLDPGSTPASNSSGDWQAAPAVGPEPGQVYVAFNRYGNNYAVGEVMVAASSDGGRTFDAPVRASPAGEIVYDRPFIAADRAGTVYVDWANETRPKARGLPLEVASSSDGGRTFRAPSVVARAPYACRLSTSICTPEDLSWGELAAGTAGSVFVVWNESKAFRRPARPFFSASHDGGATWSAPLMLGVPKGSSVDDIYWPALAVAANGRIDVAFTDQARDRTTGYANFDLTSSSNGGASFATPIRLDSVHSNTQRPGYFTSVAVASSDAAVYAVWTDTRRGDRTNKDEDTFFASAAFPQRGSSKPILSIALPILAILLIVGYVLARPRRRHHPVRYWPHPLGPLLRIRRRISIIRAGGRCLRCGSRRRLTIDYPTNARLDPEPRREIRVLCRPCSEGAQAQGRRRR